MAFSFPSSIPDQRLRRANDAGVDADAAYVLYWMTGHRRTRFNFALQRAVELANRLGRPLVILEALRCDYPWASRRHHRFILHGMTANRAALQRSRAAALTFVERRRGDGDGLLERIAERACVVVTDDAPVFFLPRMVASAAERLPVLMEAVDSNGLLPLRAADRVFARAYDFRRFLQHELAPHLLETPLADPLDDLEHDAAEVEAALDEALHDERHRRGLCDDAELADLGDLVRDLPVDAGVDGGAVEGGPEAATSLLEEFLDRRLHRYEDDRRELVHRATSELSPHLHYGHVSTHEILAALAEREDWTPLSVADPGRGQRLGWWGMSAPAETFLDELVTWRELGYNMAWQDPAHRRYESLPEWARRTLAEHAGDPREHLYGLEQLEAAETHDEIWNAAQRELVRDGRIHNYLRMLWGKKILEWSPSPRDAAEVMVELNNRYALDGRDPNSYSGIYWCLGRYDRAWGPERPIFGKIRYMSSQSARRKLKLGRYLEQYGAEAGGGGR